MKICTSTRGSGNRMGSKYRGQRRVPQKDQSDTECQKVFCSSGLLQDTRGHFADNRDKHFRNLNANMHANLHSP